MHPLDRGLLALSTTLPPSSDDPADWTLGRRNRSLFELHCSAFGPRLQAWTSCPGCGENLELNLDARDLITPEEARPDGQGIVPVGDSCFRLPTSRDLALVVAVADAETAAMQLLERCRVNGPQPSAWSEEVREKAGEKLAVADPMAETRLALRCPGCVREWEEALDITAFVWAEIESRARRLLWEVHSLALAYGWTEAETLALSAGRRAMYLEMVQG